MFPRGRKREGEAGIKLGGVWRDLVYECKAGGSRSFIRSLTVVAGNTATTKEYGSNVRSHRGYRGVADVIVLVSRPALYSPIVTDFRPLIINLFPYRIGLTRPQKKWMRRRGLSHEELVFLSTNPNGAIPLVSVRWDVAPQTTQNTVGILLRKQRTEQFHLASPCMGTLHGRQLKYRCCHGTIERSNCA